MTRSELIRSGPFRLFFPMGVAAGLIGVGHWLFWTIGWIPESNSFFHAMMQVEGFLSCFVAGFLMTAIPRFLGAPVTSWAELILPAALEFGVISMLLDQHFKAAESF